MFQRKLNGDSVVMMKALEVPRDGSALWLAEQRHAAAEHDDFGMAKMRDMRKSEREPLRCSIEYARGQRVARRERRPEMPRFISGRSEYLLCQITSGLRGHRFMNPPVETPAEQQSSGVSPSASSRRCPISASPPVKP